jgi:tRNA/tmRNA/rRNA uracil-C5-methylase (TrmA/RlmC/RlmD family)
MIRLILRLLGIRDFEVCRSCETLKQQLSFANEEKKELTKTLLNIINPKVVEAAPVEINSIIQTSGTWARRRAALEAKDREEAKILAHSKNVGRPDSVVTNVDNISQLEKELGVEEEVS